MINSITVINSAGESLPIALRSPEQSGFFIKDISGLGPAKANINISESLYMDGGYFNSARGTSRNVVLSIGFYDGGVETIEEIRLKTYRYFPVKQEIALVVETDNRTAFITGYVESNEPDIFSNGESTQISVVCPDPAFYGLDTITTLFSGTIPLFTFPFENLSTTLPLLEMSTISTDTVKSVIYNGDEQTGVLITLYFNGAVTDPNVYNNTTGQQMQFSSAKIIAIAGSGLTTGDTITISTIKNNKYVYLSRGPNTYNILNAMSIASSWIYIVPGDNLFVYTAASGVSNIQFSVQHRLVYGGV